MKILSGALSAHLAEEVTTLATCWLLTLRDGAVIGFTDHSADIAIEEQIYEARTGFTPGAVASHSNLNVDSLEIEGMLDSAIITHEEVIAGRFDFAELEVFMVNYRDISQGKLPLKKGWLGEISLANNQFVAEVRGLSERSNAAIGSLYSPSCRVKFGDNSCKLDLEAFTVTGMVTDVVSNREFFDSSRDEEAGYFTAGKIIFTSGLNTGQSMEVKEYRNGNIILTLPMPYLLAEGDGYNMVAGCDKTFSTCIARFGNAVNFRGEPHVPGMDKMLETAATRSAV